MKDRKTAMHERQKDSSAYQERQKDMLARKTKNIKVRKGR